MAIKFFLDGRPVTSKELISAAEKLYGCQSHEFVRITSVASKCLRENGHTVEEYKP